MVVRQRLNNKMEQINYKLTERNDLASGDNDLPINGEDYSLKNNGQDYFVLEPVRTHGCEARIE